MQGSKKCAVRTFAFFFVWENTVHLTSSVNILSAIIITYLNVPWERHVFWFQNFNVCVAVLMTPTLHGLLITACRRGLKLLHRIIVGRGMSSERNTPYVWTMPVHYVVTSGTKPFVGFSCYMWLLSKDEFDEKRLSECCTWGRGVNEFLPGLCTFTG